MKKLSLILTLGFLLFLAFPFPVFAMHIAEGILPFKWAGLWYLVAFPFLIKGIFDVKRKSKEALSFKPFLGMMATVVFIISCMPVPVPTAGTCSHPCGTGISAILLGPIMSIFISSIALLLQALFLAHGGLTTLGADIVSMGVVGSFAGYFVFKALRACRASLFISAFIAGLLADWATYITTSFELSSGLAAGSPIFPLFSRILLAFIPTQLPLGILEGFLTGGMVVFVYNRRPDILISLGVIKTQTKIICVTLIFLLMAVCPVFAQGKWAGVDENVVEKVAEEHGRAARAPFINTDQGDLLLFVFLLAGTFGGFILGFNWHKLFVEKDKRCPG